MSASGKRFYSVAPKPRLRAITAALLATIMFCTPSHASLTLCNRTSYILYAATSEITSPRSETQGWIRIAPGDCQVARKQPLKADTYLVYARSSIAHSGPPRGWGGAYPVCVKDQDFVIRQAVTQAYCSAEGTFALPFAPLGNHGQANWTMNFDESPKLTLLQAQLAGAKRLLKDLGYKIGAIDSKPDRQTELALRNFRKRMKFSPQDGNTALFEALEQQARNVVAPAGYTICNTGKNGLLVALGQTQGKKAVSRGWWSVAPGACAKAITSALSNDSVYLLAQTKNGSTVVGGAKKFCTTTPAFEIQGAENCSARGFAESGFARTGPYGRDGYIAEIGAAGLEPQKTQVEILK